MLSQSVSYTEAIKISGLQPLNYQAPKRVITLKPSLAWSLAIEEVVQLAKKQLGRIIAARRARKYLTADRLLKPETAKRQCLGYLGHNIEEDINGKVIHIPTGITIPWYYKGVLTGLSVKRPKGASPKYYTVPGSKRTLYYLPGCQQTLFVVEGEFDAMLLNQETGVPVVATGSNACISYGVRSLRKVFDKVCVIPDSDKAGEAMRKKWRKYPAIQLPNGKDITEFAAKGGNLKVLILNAKELGDDR